MISRIVKWAVAVLALWVLITYVWPTRYHYDRVTFDGDTYPVRIHRVTGEAEMLLPDEGWAPMKAEDQEGASPRDPT